jgi:hypothetical protein
VEEWASHVLVSDDGGTTWRVVAVPNNSSEWAPGLSLQGQECQAVQAPDGILVLNMRTAGDKLGEHGVRQVSYSSDSGASWSFPQSWTPTGAPFSGGASEASLLAVPGAPPQLLFLAPLGNEPFSWSRSNLTLWRSPDFGRSWSFAGTVDAGTGGYSSMFLLNGTTVGIVHESHVVRRDHAQDRPSRRCCCTNSLAGRLVECIIGNKYS